MIPHLQLVVLNILFCFAVGYYLTLKYQIKLVFMGNLLHFSFNRLVLKSSSCQFPKTVTLHFKSPQKFCIKIG